MAYIASTVFELFMVLCYGFGAERLHIDYMGCGMLGMWFCRHSCGRNLYESRFCGRCQLVPVHQLLAQRFAGASSFFALQRFLLTVRQIASLSLIVVVI